MTWEASAEGAACEGCDPYRGDTACSEARPILCVAEGAVIP